MFTKLSSSNPCLLTIHLFPNNFLYYWDWEQKRSQSLTTKKLLTEDNPGSFAGGSANSDRDFDPYILYIFLKNLMKLKKHWFIWGIHQGTPLICHWLITPTSYLILKCLLKDWCKIHEHDNTQWKVYFRLSTIKVRLTLMTNKKRFKEREFPIKSIINWTLMLSFLR